MGKYAVVQHDMVENVIVLNENQIEEFETILDAELVNALPLGLCIGDLRVGNNWTRNLNGVQTILEELTPQQQTDYNGLRENVESFNNIINSAELSLQEGIDSISNQESDETISQLLNNAENSLLEGVESVG